MWQLPSIVDGWPVDGLQALEETIDIARQTGIRVVASHVKARGRASWGRSQYDIELANAARAEGLKVYFDQYPYETNGGGPQIMIPLWALAPAGYDRSGGNDDPRLRAAGVRFDVEPEGTFYCWGDISGLPGPINDGMSFFRAALEKQVITVPGEFFDVNPGKRRSGRPSRFRHYVRFSFGPEKRLVTEGVRRIGEMVREEGK